ncbi:hypothetical protein ACI65C_012725 [Semiaphis heraclei]
MCALAVLYTVPWYSYFVYHHGAKTYSPGAVLAVVGNVPVEEYVLVVMQTVFTSLWALMFVHWSTPCLNFNFDKRSYLLIRWVPISLLAAVAAVGYAMTVRGQETFYLGSILCWASPAIALMWYGAGNFFTKKIIPSSIAIAGPTLYMCWVERTTVNDSGKFAPEEALFYFIANFMVVLAGSSYDKAYGMIVTYSLDFPHQFNVSCRFVRQMLRAFATSEYATPSDVTQDIKTSIKVLSTSNAFGTSNYLFHAGIRLDLIILYAFCRVTDEMFDSKSDEKKKKLKLELSKQFISEVFSDRKSDYDVKRIPKEVKIDWKKYESEFTDFELSSYRALSRIAFFLPRKPFEELFAGYQWDLELTLVRNEKDLMLYTSYVAGSIGAMCLYVIMYRYGNDMNELVDNADYLTKQAYKIGQGLQLVNIARDLVSDSESLGRCYFPAEYMDNEKEDLRILRQEKNPRSLGNKKLKKYSSKLIQLANKQQFESVGAIKYLPQDLIGSVLASTEMYRGLIKAIQSCPTYPTRASLPKLSKLLIVLNTLYIKSIQYIF